MRSALLIIFLVSSLLGISQSAPEERKPPKRYIVRKQESPKPGTTVITTTTTITKTITVKEQDPVKTVAPSKQNTKPNTIQTVPTTQKIPVQQKIIESNDTIFHYYTNKKVSVKITPWVNQERTLLFYDLMGNLTYSMENVRHSYTVFTDLKFHPNGAVSEANSNMNPGASMYWYTEHITFNTVNEPETRRSEQHPVERVELPDIQIWNKQQRKWIKQESVGCQPVPQKN